MQIDSGADHSISNNKSILNNYKSYSDTQYMSTISGDKLHIQGKGQLGDLIDPVYYAQEAKSSVIAVKDLQNKNLMTYFPSGKGSGCKIINPINNEVIFLTDEDYNINIENDNNGNNNTMETSMINTVKSKMNLDTKQLSFLIPDLQRKLGYKSLEAILGIARCTADFPYTAEQIRRHYVQFPEYLMGRIVKSSYTANKTIRNETIKIGNYVSTDCMEIDGGNCGIKGVQLFIDRKSLFASALFTPGPGTATTLAECVLKIKSEYSTYGHNLKCISSDYLPTYQAPEYEQTLANAGIRHQETAPYEHNGVLTERIIRICNEQITSMKAAASWIPDKLICFVIMLWIHLWNSEESDIKGISRNEEFTGRKPAADGNAISGALGDCYIVNISKEQRIGGRFNSQNLQLHGKPVMYLAPNPQTKDGHYFYDPDTDRVICRRSYRRVAGIPQEWLQNKHKTGLVRAESGDLYDFINGPAHYDVWQKGASSEAIEADTIASSEGGEDITMQQPGVLNPVEHISKRTRSSGPCDGNMLKKIRAETMFTKCSTMEKVLKGDDPSTMSQELIIIRAAPMCGTEGDYVGLQGGGVHAEPQSRYCSDPVKDPSGRVKQTLGSTRSNELDKDLARTILTESTVRMVHVEENPHSKYGIKFIRLPTKEEIYNVKRHLKHVINKCGKKKNYNADNPTLNAALNSQEADSWITFRWTY